MTSDIPQRDNKNNEDDGDEGDDEVNQPEDQYLNNPQHTVSSWIKLLVKHFVAKHRLEAHSRRLHTRGITSAFEINILRVDKIEDDLPSWEEVTSIITSVIEKYFPSSKLANFPSSGTDSQMINWLLQYINETLQGVPSSTLSESSTSSPKIYNRILRVFRDISDGGEKRPPFYTRHCELCMAIFSCLKSKEVAQLESQISETQDDATPPNFWQGETRRLRVNIHQLQQVIFVPSSFPSYSS
jgi:hypothetical protein